MDLTIKKRGKILPYQARQFVSSEEENSEQENHKGALDITRYSKKKYRNLRSVGQNHIVFGIKLKLL